MTTLDVATEEVSPLALRQDFKRSYTIAIWGSAGSGKSLIAANLAFEFANFGAKTLLVDLDQRRPSIAALLALVNAGPGITAATRLGRQGRLNPSELARLSADLRFGKHQLDVLPGLSSPLRWPELDGPGLDALLDTASKEFEIIVFDLNDEIAPGLVSPGSQHDRNFAARWAISNSQSTLGLFSADPVGINRFLDLAKTCDFEFLPIANRVNSATVGRNPERQIREAIFRAAKISPHSFLPWDPVASDSVLASAKPLLLQKNSSKLAIALHALALELYDTRPAALNSRM
jgi:MinD-like ATPase involved in chromosome partitioning or flagellar assembly